MAGGGGVTQIGWWLRKIRQLGILILMMNILLVVLVKSERSMREFHKIGQIVDKVNKNGGPYVGLVMAYTTEETVLLSSGLFIPNPKFPSLQLSGRKFNIGKIKGTNVIYVLSGQRRLNAGITVQILIDFFDIRGIVHYGIAGSANNSLSFGDVSVPKYLAFTGSWTWMESEEEKGEYPQMKIASYNVPKGGKNELAKVMFKTEELYSVGQPMKEVFWLEVDQAWFKLAAQLQDFKLKQCVNATYCLPKTPKVEYGLRGSTADVFVQNAAFRKFLFNKFQVSTIDEESSAVVMTCISSKVPSIVFRGVSDLAGGDGEKFSESLSSLAAINALQVTVKFIELVGKQYHTFDDHK